MSSFLSRGAGILALSLACLTLDPAGAEVVPPATAPVSAPSAALAADVEARLRALLPDEPIRVRSANAGLVLSGQVSDSSALHRALALAGVHAPGRVSNLMTVGRLPRIELTLQLAEMPRTVARNLSASMGMAGMFAPTAPGAGQPADGSLPGFAGGGMDVPGLLAALESKGLLRPLAEATLTVTAGEVTQLPAGRGCDGPAGTGIGMDLTPTLDEGGRISVTLRTCLPGRSAASGDESVVTIQLQDGQTLAVADVLPDLLRDPGRYSAALAGEPTLGPLLASEDYRAGLTEVMILISARVGGPGLSRPEGLAAGHAPVPTGSGVVFVREGSGAGPEAVTLSGRLLD